MPPAALAPAPINCPGGKPHGCQECQGADGFRTCEHGTCKPVVGCGIGNKCTRPPAEPSTFPCEISCVGISQDCHGKPDGCKECDAKNATRTCDKGTWIGRICDSGLECFQGASACDASCGIS